MLKAIVVLYLLSYKRIIKGHSSAMTTHSMLHSLMVLPEQENIPVIIIVRKRWKIALYFVV